MIKSYTANTGGNFAIMFGVVAAVLGLGVAIAIDVSSMHKAKSELQSNLDSAALTAVVEVAKNGTNDDNQGGGNDDDYYKSIVLKSLMSNGYDLGSVTPNVEIRNGSLFVSTRIDHPLQFGGLLGKSNTGVYAATEVSLPGNGTAVEVALVLDNTESMNFDGKMTALKQGAREFIDAIEESDSGSKIALVPFARYVDIGEDKRNEPWLNVPAEFDTDRTWQQATHTDGTCTPQTVTTYNDGEEYTYESQICVDQITTYEEQSRVIESRWIGCVGVRSDGLHLQDGSYNMVSEKIPGLLNKNPYEVTGLGWDLESWCPDTVTPLTDDYDLLDEQVGHLYGTDRTYIPMGLSWGRRVLSPQAPFTEADTVNPKRQIMVLMSDGQNTAYLDEPGAGKFETIPYIEDLSSSQQQNGDIPPGTNEDTAALCEAIKADGTEVYTIAFKVKNAVTRNLLTNCASSPTNYFDAGSNDSLIQAFKTISAGLQTEIRVMH